MLWNEPNNLSHWNRDLDPEWDGYAAMVRLAGARIAAVAPGVRRVLGGISPIDPWFIRRLFERGVGEAVDVVAVHGFPLDWNRWHMAEWPARVRTIREAAPGKPVWATEVGVSSFVSPALQAWALPRTIELLANEVDRVYWYALLDLPETWEATTRHRQYEGIAYFRHFRMGVYTAAGEQKPAAAALARCIPSGVGVCEWVYWQEEARLRRMVERLRQLGVRRLRTGLAWSDWFRPGATAWFDHVLGELAEFDLTLTLCFTPEHLGIAPHYTSPPREPASFADFCQAVLEHYHAHQRPAFAPERALAGRLAPTAAQDDPERHATPLAP